MVEFTIGFAIGIWGGIWVGVIGLATYSIYRAERRKGCGSENDR